MKVSAVLVTRGDVDMRPILDSLPEGWERVVYDNGAGRVQIYPKGGWYPDTVAQPVPDVAVFGRYAAIHWASGEVIYVQDDDVIVSDPQAIVNAWRAQDKLGIADEFPSHSGSWVCCNMPPEFRHNFYRDHALVGFGAVFHRDLPVRTFGKLCRSLDMNEDELLIYDHATFARTCDIPLTFFSARVLVDVPKQGMPYESAPNRMWKQPEHVAERSRMLALCRGEK